MRSIAIIVGINNYPEPTGQGELFGTVADACDFAEWALDTTGGNVAPDDLYFWTYPWANPEPGKLRDYLNGVLPEQANGRPPMWDHQINGRAVPEETRPPTAGEIIYTIERAGRDAFKQTIPGAGGERLRALVFLAGHGLRAVPATSLQEETCFVAADFRPEAGNQAPGLVPCESLKLSLLNRRFDEAIMFLDCCRVRTSKLRMKAVSLADQDGEKDGSWSLAFAAQNEKPAFETLTAPIRGAFSATLMTGLRSVREGDQHILSAGRLRTYVRENISRHTDTGQMPNVTFMPDDDIGPIIVTGAVAGAPATPAPLPAAPPFLSPGPVVNLAALPPGTQVVLKDGDGVPVTGVDLLEAGPDPVQLPELTARLYSLEVVGDSNRFQVFRHPTTETVVVR